MMHVLGLDAGGTKTVCLLADEDGHVLAPTGPGLGLTLKREFVERVSVKT